VVDGGAAPARDDEAQATAVRAGARAPCEVARRVDMAGHAHAP
jgi:hypothetical protein